MSAYDAIRAEIEGIRTIDTHEHLMRPDQTRETDLFDLINTYYTQDDFIAAGLPVDEAETRAPTHEEGWKRLAPFLDAVRSTNYFRSLMAAVGELYGFTGEIGADNWTALSEQVAEKARDEDWFRHVLADRAGIERYLWDGMPFDLKHHEGSIDLCAPVIRMDRYTYAWRKKIPLVRKSALRGEWHWMTMNELGEKYGCPVKTFDDYLEVIDRAFRENVEKKAYGVKCALAYERTVYFAEVDKDTAARVWGKGLGEVTPLEAKQFEDFIIHYNIQKSIEYGLPYQIHTGLQARGKNTIFHTNPSYLNNLFLKYPEAVFCVFHGGYPYGGEMGVMAKYFPNVYLDFCWLPIISKSAAVRCLHEWIEVVPANKFMWGGDCRRPEQTFGALLFARDVAAQVLSEKVDSGYFGLDTALHLARGIFRENAKRVFKL